MTTTQLPQVRGRWSAIWRVLTAECPTCGGETELPDDDVRVEEETELPHYKAADWAETHISCGGCETDFVLMAGCVYW